MASGHHAHPALSPPETPAESLRGRLIETSCVARFARGKGQCRANGKGGPGLRTDRRSQSSQTGSFGVVLPETLAFQRWQGPAVGRSLPCARRGNFWRRESRSGRHLQSVRSQPSPASCQHCFLLSLLRERAVHTAEGTSASAWGPLTDPAPLAIRAQIRAGARAPGASPGRVQPAAASQSCLFAKFCTLCKWICVTF